MTRRTGLACRTHRPRWGEGNRRRRRGSVSRTCPLASGGFLGVDVFFVLSGYLITSLLLAEHRRTGHIDLRKFWIGRARRLLPGAILVIGVCLVVGAVFLRGDLDKLRADALTSLLYVNNWHQIVGAHSYFAAFGLPSPLQHYWSLAVEEQFYLLCQSC